MSEPTPTPTPTPTPVPTNLTSRITPEALNALYAARGNGQYCRVLLIGAKGVGKTTMLRTARRPVYLHSLDPQGEQSLLAKDGTIPPWLYIDLGIRVEGETGWLGNDADGWRVWKREFDDFARTIKPGDIGTFAIDLTTWAEMLYEYLKVETKHPVLEMKDWGTFKDTVQYYVKKMLTLPCDVVIMGHIQQEKDEVTGKILFDLLIAGQSSQRIPVWLSEIWYLCIPDTVGETKFDPTGKVKVPQPTRYLVTGNDGRFKGSTRMGRDGVFSLHEIPDILALRRKAGWEADHFPPFNEGA